MTTETCRSTAIRPYLEKEFLWLVVLFLVPAIPLAFLGYGSDNDTYQEVQAGVQTWTKGIPITSRTPGYWLHEALIFILSQLGGSLLVNIATIIISLIALYRFWLIVSKLDIRWRFPISLCLAWNPWYLIASTSAIDYIWAVFFIIVSIESYLNRKPFRSGILGGIATGFRLGSIFPLTGAFFAASLSQFSISQIRRFLIAASIASVVGLCFYVPSWVTHSWVVRGKDVTWLQGLVGDQALWTLKMHIGRAVYKPLYLMGIIADLCILSILYLNLGKLPPRTNDQRDLLRASVGAVIGTLALFAKYPIEYSYLLPVLPFLLIIIGNLMNRSRAWQPWALVAASVSFWFVSFPLATPNNPGNATNASIGIHIEGGVLLRDVRTRIQLMGCESLDCYNTRIDEYSNGAQAL